MADILDKITCYKLEEIARAKEEQPLQVVAEYARSAGPVRSFVGALEAKIKTGRPARTLILQASPRPTKPAAQRVSPC